MKNLSLTYEMLTYCIRIITTEYAEWKEKMLFPNLLSDSSEIQA
jgi:hypothetical protein